ncbi:uncharacterized protein LOC100209604 isoform X4 [Hydra vulgaris]|uniref:Uncharacterized protein LOC100209604 isoform X4 n=1 Tax=Hydra vulgaris TaxID=6087 RepID=A0ABM4B6H2_HYDVU
MEMKYLFNTIAFEAHLLYFIHREQLTIINNLDFWRLYISQAKSEKDVVFVYFSALGSFSHYTFMKFVHKQVDAYKFAFTNDEIFAAEMGMPSKHRVCIWYASCSQTNYSSECPVFKRSFIGDLKYSSLILFINFYDTPIVSEINNGSTIYSDEVTLLFFFFDNDKSKMEFSDKIGSVVNSLIQLSIDVRAVLVDKRKNPELFESYGIHENVILPTVMLQYPLESRKTEHKGITKIVDSFPFDVDLTNESIYKFVHDSILKPQVYNPIYDIELHSFKNLLIPRNSLTEKTHRVLIGGCTKHRSYLKNCALFNSNFRRLVRTIYLDRSVIMKYKYIDYTDEPSSFMRLPLLNFYDPTTGIHEFSYSDVTYLNMLLWLNSKIGSAIKPIPFSRSDFVKFNFKSVRSSQLTQDDEVSQRVLQLKNERLYQDSVELLTDTSFNNTINKYDFIVVLFFVLWDERSYLIQPHFAKVHSMMESQIVKIAKVDCASEYYVCTFQKVYCYPTIRVFKKEKHLIDYNGFFDAIRLEQIIKHHTSASLIELKETEIHDYIEGTLPRFFSPHTSTSVLAWFSSRKSEAFSDYTKFAENNIDKAQFSFLIGNHAKEILKISSDDVFFAVYKEPNKVQPVSIFTGPYNKESLEMFMKTMLVEMFGKLTPQNLPAYKLLNKPLMVLFINEKEINHSLEWKAIEQMVKDSLFKNIVPVWMNTEDALSRKICTSYIGLQKRNSVSLIVVNHTKGEVYYLPTSKVTVKEVLIQEISIWLLSLESGKLKATSFLMVRHWKPSSEGIDFDHDIQKTHQVKPQSSKRMFFGDDVYADTAFYRSSYNSVISSNTEGDFRFPHQQHLIHDEL